jgi:hypothetical protein
MEEETLLADSFCLKKSDTLASKETLPAYSNCTLKDAREQTFSTGDPCI